MKVSDKNVNKTRGSNTSASLTFSSTSSGHVDFAKSHERGGATTSRGAVDSKKITTSFAAKNSKEKTSKSNQPHVHNQRKQQQQSGIHSSISSQDRFDKKASSSSESSYRKSLKRNHDDDGGSVVTISAKVAGKEKLIEIGMIQTRTSWLGS